MTIEELNSLLENVTNNVSDDALMLESFDKVRNAFKELLEKVASITEELDTSKSNYDKLRETKVRDFFNNEDNEEIEDVKEESKDDDKKEELSVSDLFDDGIEIQEDLKKEEDENAY